MSRIRGAALRFVHLFLSVGFLNACFFLAFTRAQTTPDLEEGMKPYGSFHGGDIDQVSLTSGKLVLNIPLVSYPQRGGKIKMAFGVRWQNITPRLTEICDINSPPCREQPTRDGGTTGSLGFVDNLTPYASVSPPNTLTLATPDGSIHQNAYLNPNYRSIDASGFSYTTSNATLVAPDGLRYLYTSSSSSILAKVEDPNGNYVTPTISGGNVVGWTDTLGRSIQTPAGAVATTDYSHCTGANPITSASNWTIPGPSGGNVTFKFCYANYSYHFTWDTPNESTAVFQGTIKMLQSIVQPNLTTWTFNYDPAYAALSQITLPTGGTIGYTWVLSGSLPCQYSSSYDPLRETTTYHYGFYLTVASRTVNANDGTGAHTWTYGGTVTDPLGNATVYTITGLGGTGSMYVTKVQSYQGSSSTGTLLKTVTTDYSYAIHNTTPPLACQTASSVVAIRATTTWPSGPTTKQETDYDSGFTWASGSQTDLYGLPIAIREYDYGNGSPGALLRQTKTAYMALSGPNASSYLANNILKLPYTVQILDGSGTQKSFTQNNYDETTLVSSGLSASYHWEASPDGTFRGNPTSAYRWLNSGTLTCPNGSSAGTGSNVISRLTFFDDGKPQTATDPCGNATTSAYSLTYSAAYPTTVTNALNQSVTNTFDLNTGLLASATDANSLTTSYTYDNMWRVSQVTGPNGSVDTVSHQESSTPFTATYNKQINGSQTETSVNIFDGMGRVSQHQLTSDPQGTVFSETTYDALGRVSTVTNPHRTCGTDITSSCGTTTYGYDPLGRKTSETYPDNSVLQSAYCGPSTLVTDPTGKWRRSRVDGLGRLVEVDEPNSTTATVATTGCPGTGEPIWVTTYGYDTLGNLISALQNASRSRSFTYDSFSRLLTSNNPETGTITYTYNPDGPVLTKTDARGIVTCSGTWSGSTCSASTGYDALHRSKTISYSNGDPSITANYDESTCLSPSPTPCQNIGQRTSMTDAAGSESWSYHVDNTNSDTTRRTVHVNKRTTSGIIKTSTYYLDLAGNLAHIAYPTGRIVDYTFDSAGRPSTATDSSNGITYATGFKTSPGSTCIANVVCYSPQGTPYAVSIGQTSTFTGLNVTESYNTRLQPLEIKASSITNGVTMNAIDVTYNFVDPVSNHNAGHVYGITNTLDATRSQTFTYDQLNRIVTAQTTSTFSTAPTKCWGETYALDAWANLNSIAQTTNSAYTGCSQESGFSQTAGTNNRLPSFGYDSAGNTTSDGVNSYTWDAESQMKTGAGVNYGYDGQGRRVSKSSGKLYWYGSGGEILAETNGSGATTAEYIFFGGKRVAMLPAAGNAQFYVEDMLGTSRIVTTNTGAVCYDADFYPYGGERTPYTNNCPTSNAYKFEGKERDTETGDDDFGARYYSNRFGRWLSSDWSAVPAPVPYANLTNPQTLNLYSMVGDDPESFADLDGHAGYSSIPNIIGEHVLGNYFDCYFCIELASNLTPAEMEAQQQALQASSQTPQTPAQSAQPPAQNTPAAAPGNQSLPSTIRQSYKWYQFLSKWLNNFIEVSKLRDEEETDKRIYRMATQMVFDPLANHNNPAIGYMADIAVIEEQNLLLDYMRQGLKFSEEVDPAAETMGKTFNAVFNDYGMKRDENNRQIDRLLDDAEEALHPH